MTKRGMWILNCLLWAGVWFVLGVIVPVLWVGTLLALAMILLPVGVPEGPRPANKHNPEEWKRNG